MRYNIITLKSIRILNRLFDFIEQNQLDFENFMSDIVYKELIKTKSSNKDVEI